MVYLKAERSSSDDESIFDEATVNAMIQELSSIGEITLVRFTEDTMFVTFRDGQTALNAHAKRNVVVNKTRV